MIAARSSGKFCPQVEAAFLDLHNRFPLRPDHFRRHGDQVAKVGQVLVTAREDLQRDQVPDRCHWHETSGNTPT